VERTTSLEKGESQSKLLKRINKIVKEEKAYLPSSIIDELVLKLAPTPVDDEKLVRIVKKTLQKYELHLIEPNEACGIVAAQSIGEPGTQMSLPWSEKIVLRINGATKLVEIGKFVDGVFEKHGVGSEIFDFPPDLDIAVPSLNDQEKIEFKRVKACSRHQAPAQLLELTLRSGRKIVATPAHSFVIRKDNHVVPIKGENLKLGDRIPVIKNLRVDGKETLELSPYLSKTKYWYGSELKKAAFLGKNYLGGYRKEYQVPVKIDQLRNCLKGSNTNEIGEGLVYPYQTHGVGIPEVLNLDEKLGFLIGAYLSEGNLTAHQVSISNLDGGYLANLRNFAREFGLTFGEYENLRGFSRGNDLRINSTVLADFLKVSCGSGSTEKKVPEFAFDANEEFIGELLSGYFEGDGNVSVSRRVLRASSNSKELIDGLALLLTRLGIFCRKGRNSKQYNLSISYRYAPQFKEKIRFVSLEKKEKLDKLVYLSEKSGGHSYDLIEMVGGYGELFVASAKKLALPSRIVNNFTKKQRIGRNTLGKYLNRFEELSKEKGVDLEAELKILRRMQDADVIWDEIVDLSKVDYQGNWVYDLSVPGLETFSTAEGVITHNTMRTFHYAGVAEINVALGLPRLIEIVDARKEPSTPMMTIYLEGAYRVNPELAQQVANEIEVTKAIDICNLETDLTNLSINIIPIKEMERKQISLGKILGALNKVPKTSSKVAENRIIVTLEESSYKRLQATFKAVLELKVKGINGIKRAVIRREDKEYVIYTEGSNFSEVLKIKGIDRNRTTTNNIQNIYEVLGIEAARNAIIIEAANTLADQGLVVDLRHIMLVADLITYDGNIKAVGRHGISGEKSSVLARAAFEITVNHLLMAGQKGERDPLEGVAENIIVGQPISLGTGAVQLMMDFNKLKKGK
jgi:DNA-directed RNA polymerase subunit A"